MSKKHYIAISEIISKKKLEYPNDEGLQDLVYTLAYYFQIDNARFNLGQFVEDCGFHYIA